MLLDTRLHLKLKYPQFHGLLQVFPWLFCSLKSNRIFSWINLNQIEEKENLRFKTNRETQPHYPMKGDKVEALWGPSWYGEHGGSIHGMVSLHNMQV